jgi:hypothetical protein
MQLAANAAQLVLWTWNIERDEIWFSDNGTTPARMLGPRRSLVDLLDRIHPEDRTRCSEPSAARASRTSTTSVNTAWSPPTGDALVRRRGRG